jgi:aerobic carbon-monoxide dehydrogenase small subunit
MVLASVTLLKRSPNPTDEQIRAGLSGNLCRCTGYMRIFEAVRKASADLTSPAKAGREQ